ncbi:glycoside hydrolase [Phycicoccus sp. M110.8]|uniref:glycoside hydrolase n=1 Tax=Phycicoccus sp. M110.8 TaxID=3075433 RepID=UPI0028FD5A58|nr:glycoside hydrolase [Phycicoccus sp. M110.8]MDU0313749.1 glycoside hydrolase [Phycicoccus sp. M110.8]
MSPVPRSRGRGARPGRRLAVVLSAGALAATGALATAAPGVAGAPAADAAAGVPSVRIQPDPSYQQPAFEGWGTSLVWFANATGDYPPAVREKLADLVFGKDGLNLNIARYNIGGGNAPDVEDYLRPGGAVQGWWKAPAGTTRTDTSWWSAEEPADWNPDADRTQRWWVDRIKAGITKWETFSNSPPWFMTESGYVSGNFDASKDQLKASSVDDFAKYLVGATTRLEQAHGISVDTIDPFNEPNTSYWGTQLGADGKPTGGRQEGAHIGPELQQEVVRALAPVLASSTTKARISAMDETNPGTFVRNWMTYPADVKASVSQMNVHTYGTAQRTAVRDLSKSDGKPLWMSEVEGSWGNGQSFTSMEPGLGMAQHMTDDLRELEPSAWVFWQPVEDYDNMKPGGESAAGANWGSIQLPFDCTAQDTLQTCPIYTNQKFNTVRNFTHYIRPGDHVVKVDDTSTVAAVRASDRTATLVHTNGAKTAQDVTVDLSKFRHIGPKAAVTAVVTDASGALVQQTPVPVEGTSATVRVPAESVTTLVVSDVRDVAKDAATFQDGHLYRFTGVQSGKSLDAEGTGLVIRGTDGASGDQLWTVTPVTTGVSNRERYQLRSLDGRQVALRDGSLVLETAQPTPDRAAQWYLSTTGDGTWTMASATGPGDIEVGGQATADGSAVGVWQPNSDTNQRWRLTDETVRGVTDVQAFTLPGLAPTLPETVVPDRAGGSARAIPVQWRAVPAVRWQRPGQVFVFGTATDPATGTEYPVRAVVTVDTVSTTQPASARTYVGGTPDLPATVQATSDRYAAEVTLPVRWDTGGATYDAVGQVTVPGTATLPDGSTVTATCVVTVTEPVEANAALAPGTTATATYTEPGYSPQGVVNGNLTDKAWSNWRSGSQRPGDTLTVTLPAPRDVSRVVTRFYQDGGNVSYATSLRVEALVDGAWKAVSGDVAVPQTGPAAPVVSVPVTPVRTTAVRVVMTASSYMTVSEVEVMAKSAAPAAP